MGPNIDLKVQYRNDTQGYEAWLVKGGIKAKVPLVRMPRNPATDTLLKGIRDALSRVQPKSIETASTEIK